MTDTVRHDHPTGTTRPNQWGRLSRATGIAGLVAFVLVFVPIIAISTQNEPPFTATADEAHAFLVRAGEVGWADLAGTAVALAALVLVWSVAGLSLLLARAEGSPPWRSVVAGVSGVLLPAYGLFGVSWDAAGNRAADIDPGLAAYAFDVGNLGFANVWDATGSFAIAAGWVVVSTRMLPRGLGWWAIGGRRRAGAGPALLDLPGLARPSTSPTGSGSSWPASCGPGSSPNTPSDRGGSHA